MTTRIGCLILGLFSLALSIAAQVGGSGTPKHIPIWTSSTTLGDSIIFQTSGFPVGTTLQATGGDGLFGQFGHNGWPGGSIKLTAGHGGGAGTSVSGGPGGSVLITGGTGGSGTTCCAQNVNGNGGSITLQPGAGGTFVLTHGLPGNVILAITEAKPSPFGPGGKITAKDHNVMLGDFFVVFHSDSTGPMGQQKTVDVMGYDPKEKVYTYDGFTTSGERNKATGTVSGNAWVWTFSGEEQGKSFKGRFNLTEDSPTSYSFSEEMSSDGGPWTKLEEGKATKVK